MRALIQRVTQARVHVDGHLIGETGPGLLILICAMQDDDDTAAVTMAAKIAKLRIFTDPEGKMNRSVRDIAGTALVVSQFTLAADTSRGNRPGFSQAAPPTEGNRLYQLFTESLRAEGISCETGKFGADMQVSLTNDGPVTIWLDV
ncbi:D-tyrosyl-tRNA(Tyr) deacylase [Pseudohalocynthiibacter aestuariivivens]|nr:D-aminoacyl-tRNA deacylase [Pseudohalocynthiibacter aestuariivivens]QIE44827.1 D-tyrosyl-tRNA(Tyr) deacylase [Pseudohalocynthiibacter aestuariivivens]